MPRHRLQLAALGIALTFWVSVARATVVPLSGILTVKAGVGSSIALREGGTVWTWGDNSLGQLGNGTTDPALMPAQVLCGEASGDPGHCSSAGHLKNAVSVAAGSLAAMALLDNGSVLMWGLNSRFNNANNSITPVFVVCGAADAAHCSGGRITGATQVAVGFSHLLILLDDGAVLAWGTNNNGNLGNNQAGVPSATPVQVSGLTSGSGVIAIAAGQNYSLAVKSNGTVVGWGANSNGQVGDGTTTVRAVPAPVACRIGDQPNTAFCTGANALQGVRDISAGNAMSLALMNDSSVLAWGGNSSGQTGDGTTVQRTSPVNVCAVGAISPCDLANGNVLMGVASLPGSTLSATGYALLSNGTVLAWGNNASGQLGDGTTASRSTPAPVSGLTGVSIIAAGDAHAVARMADGTARAWGSNTNGQLGNGSISATTTPIPTAGLGSGSGVIAVSSRAQFTLALRSDGSVLAWGSNSNGQLGDGTLQNRNTPVQVVCRTGDAPGSAFCSSAGHLQGAIGIATGNSNYSLALLADGSVLSWGINSSGQLGDGTSTQRTRPVNVCDIGAVPPCGPASGNILTGATAVAAGGSTGFARTSAGGVMSWGNNANGFLGNGSSVPASSSTPFNVVCRAGDATGTAFCSATGLLQGVLTITPGNTAPIAVMNDGTVLAWGLNLVNQLGDGTSQNRNRPVNVCAVGAVAPCTVANGNVLQGIVAVAGAGNTGFALTSSGAVLGWGNNAAGTIGDGTITSRPTPVNVCTVGAAPPCLLGSGNVLQAASAIAGGVNSAYALLPGGSAVAWGTNSSGQLGDGTLISRVTPVPVSGLTGGVGAVSLSAGAGGAVALLADGSVVAWGANGVGELGDGTVYTANLTPAPVVSDDVTPPLASATATPSRLWPPDNREVAVQIRVAAGDDVNLPSQPVSALTIVSNEPQSIPVVTQPGAFVFDSGSSTSGVSVTTVQLVAGLGNRGGRVYTVTGTVTDAAGHSTPFSVQVTVARSR